MAGSEFPSCCSDGHLPSPTLGRVQGMGGTLSLRTTPGCVSSCPRGIVPLGVSLAELDRIDDLHSHNSPGLFQMC